MAQENTFQKVTIALVEDDEDDYILLEDYLNDFRWAEATLEWVDNYTDGLALLLENRHDVYLLDYRLGGQTGLELLQAALELGCRGPVIVLTGKGDRTIDLAVMESGAVDYLIKENMDGETLERAIRYAIYRKRSEMELAEMQRRLADSQEEERLHLARELHDGPLQELLGIRLHMGALTNALPEAAPRVAQMQEQVQHIVDTLRNLCGELRPPSLPHFGLDKVIGSYVQKFRNLHSEIEIDMDLDKGGETLDPNTRLALYRIFQNAMANIANHAQATRIRIEVHVDSHQIVMQIADDGKGFRVPHSLMTMARQGHYGLLGASERAESIGGRLSVHSEPGQGTTVIVVAPRHPTNPTIVPILLEREGETNG
ncbi:MAG: response regulator [Caldilineaceae bacterium]|nr:response regulator [Caldilineaceae bacterium]